MRGLWRVFADKRLILSGIIAITAAIAFNNWVLALLLNRQLLFKGGSVSELTVHGQPHAILFQSLDVIAGILFSIFVLLVGKFMSKTGKSMQVLVYGGLIFGIANVVDALLSLPCSNTLDKACSIPITINWSHFNFPSHGYSSVLIAVFYFVLPLAGIYYARAEKNQLFLKASVVTLLVALASLVSAGWEYLSLHAFSVKASGWAQGAQMLVLGLWFIFWYLAVRRGVSLAADPKD